jgi:hypothetical protein
MLTSRIGIFLLALGLLVPGVRAQTGSPASRAREARSRRPPPPSPARIANDAVDDDPGVQRAVKNLIVEARLYKPTQKPKKKAGPTRVVAGRLFFRMYEFKCATGPCWYESLGFMGYISGWVDLPGNWNVLRFGIGLASGFENSQERTKWWQHNFLIEVLLAVGIQYPARVTPYLELTIGLGAMHRNLYNQDTIDFTYSVGLDAGVDVFLYKQLNIGASIGYRRSVVDVGEAKFFIDSFTFQVGLGF